MSFIKVVENKETEGYLSVGEVALILSFSVSTVIQYCRKGLLEGSKKSKKNWHIPKQKLQQILITKEDIKDNYFTINQLAERLGVNHKSIRALIDDGSIQTEEITVLNSKGIYIQKSLQKVQILIKQKEKVEKGEFISRSKATKEFGISSVYGIIKM